MRRHIINAVEIHVVRGPRRPPPQDDQQRGVKPIHLYPEHRPADRRPRPPEQSDRTRWCYLRIGTAAGAEGLYGPIDDEIVETLARQFAPFLIGRDALATTIVWDQLERSNRHARHGYLKLAISAVDNALWDLRGRVFDAPVWQLLGGPARERIPAYASTIGTSLADESIQATAAELAESGFVGQKWFFSHGPGEGPDGVAADIRLAERVRAAAGPKAMIMFDAQQGWTLPYARAWADGTRDVRPAWLEEPFGPQLQPAFAELHRSTGLPLAAGEHLYDRADVLPYLRDNSLTVVQTDPEWCGGVTELVRICALAGAFGVAVVPHGHALRAALHVVASQSPAVTPMVELLLRSTPYRHHVEVDPPVPIDGTFALPTAPGFGIILDETKIDDRSIWQLPPL